MDIFVTLLGLCGFGLILAATMVPSRRKLLLFDLAGVVPVSIHYALLGAGAGAVLSGAYAFSDICGLARNARVRKLGAGAAFVGAVIVIVTLVGLSWVSCVALLGTAVAVGARVLPRRDQVLLVLMVSTVLWGLYGVLTSSFPQILFSVLYVVFTAVNWRRARRPVNKKRVT